MSDEIQAAGAAATAGLAAAAIEGPDASAAGHGPCANCGAEVGGRYCANCGQPAHVHRSLLHLIEEALHGLVHFDSKMWRTLPRLAVRPGTLTRDYIDGKRARYVSPLALFLFTIFLMFFVFAFLKAPMGAPDAGGPPVTIGSAGDLAGARAEVAAELAEAEAAGETEEAEALRGVERVMGAMSEGASAPEAAAGAGYRAATISEAQAVIDREIESGELEVDTGDPKRDAKIVHALENLELTLYKMQQAAYKFAFLLIPISLPLIALMFLWMRGVTWFDHTVFALYSLSFMSIFYLACMLAGGALAGVWRPGADAIGAVMIAVPPAHMFFHLGGTYRLGWFSALWRTLALLVICGAAFVAFIAVIALIGVLG